MYVCVDAGHQGGVCVYSSYTVLLPSTQILRPGQAQCSAGLLEKFECSAGVGRQQDIVDRHRVFIQVSPLHANHSRRGAQAGRRIYMCIRTIQVADVPTVLYCLLACYGPL